MRSLHLKKVTARRKYQQPQKNQDGVEYHSTEDGDGLTSMGNCKNISQLLWETRGGKKLRFLVLHLGGDTLF